MGNAMTMPSGDRALIGRVERLIGELEDTTRMWVIEQRELSGTDVRGVAYTLLDAGHRLLTSADTRDGVECTVHTLARRINPSDPRGDDDNPEPSPPRA